MAFSQQFLDELASRNDIVDVVSSYVALTKRGGLTSQKGVLGSETIFWDEPAGQSGGSRSGPPAPPVYHAVIQ